ncbi:CocE/NonD family hydrolase [Streptomyces sp. NPDC008317]|uniref:CocE/NonD family hydrolase n=1 Tax=Streptomyces sp. NPDC008317 TaxID=3364827 RepID=UPI0036F13B9C
MRFTDVSRVRSRFDVRVEASDGVDLSVDVYMPPVPGDHPVLVTRTPYDNNRADQKPPASTAPQVPSDRFKLLAARGYIVVAGDVRGRGDSDGDFEPFLHEAADGADIVTWARDLPGSNGRLGCFGAGYAGFAALAAASAAPVDALAVWSPFAAAEGLPSRGGAVRLDWLFWMHLVGGRVRGPVDAPPWKSVFSSRPLAGMHEALGRPDAPWPDWLAHLAPQDPYWSSLAVGGGTNASAPTLLVSGRWDSGLGATMAHWETVSSAGGEHSLVVGPWDSAGTRRPVSVVGGVEWGPRSVVDPDELLLEWFDHHLRDDPSSWAPAPVRVFVTGRNAWEDLDRWPVADEVETLWLTSEGRANTRIGDGRLTRDATPREAADHFVHDPGNPVPWQPDHGSFSRTGPAGFTLETSFATSRDDTLTYTAATVDVPTLVRGTPVVHLFAGTDRDDADWMVSLEDVFPGETRTVHLAHGVVRAGSVPAFRTGVPVGYRIAMTDVAHELQPGHALRLVVTSSLFPLYAINLGSADYLGATEAERGTHSVFHGPRLPSRIELPLHRMENHDQAP